MRSKGQVTVALDFALDFITSCQEAKAENITFITLYTANLELIQTATKEEKKYAGHMRDCKVSTVVDYRGQGDDIVIVVTGNNQTHGRGIAADEHVLSMLLTRQKAGLVVVGDINVANSIKKLAAEAKAAKSKRKGSSFTVRKTTGEVANVDAGTLQDVHIALWESCRVVTVPVKKDVKSPDVKQEKGKGVDKQ
ncbi:hypothetical protein F5X68DRAFT_187407 [Plectosphaerella plurivora]|uniref:DNA2/NAM7 helicase-like C-terminal domain-containing protein n=1 Tax=Plectosphaerella plurivora TaxID=936078 RepID=A0A9P8VK06_9PEZI|nr:hypothetical protein F5X68DRAFT_187407 [Plectosphaerella plurivora]